MPLWSNRAEAKVIVEWQSPQALLAGRCVVDFPLANMPLWQAKQFVPVSAWSNLTTRQEVVVWQLVHRSEVGG